MAGYHNWSMSNNAVDAYENGEMPLSKWTKDEILDAIEDELDSTDTDEIISELSKLPTRTLQRAFLCQTSWHHTGKYYNQTDFWSLDCDKVDDLTLDEAHSLVEEHRRNLASNRRTRQSRPPKTYVTALVKYTEWTGTRAHPKPVERCDIVFYIDGDKLVEVDHLNGTKRMTSLDVLGTVESTEGFPDWPTEWLGRADKDCDPKWLRQKAERKDRGE